MKPVIDVDEHGMARVNRTREAYDRRQLALVGDLSDADKEKIRRAGKPVRDAADALVDGVNSIGRFLVAIPTPVLVGAAIYWLGPSLVSGAVSGSLARRRSRRRGR